MFLAGVIHNGGVKPNIIPEETEMEYIIRTPTMAELEVAKAKALQCFEAAAQATGCQVSPQCIVFVSVTPFGHHPANMLHVLSPSRFSHE